MTKPANLACEPRIRRRLFGAAAIAACCCASVAGCAGYRFGADSMFASDIQTVYVPTFQSDSYRRGLAEQLTEAVCKEVEKRTNYKVVNNPNADSVLSGRILNEVKRIIVESPTDEPRESQVEYFIEVTWLDRQGALLAQSQKTPLPGTVANINQTADVVPEVGQSIATAQQDVCNRLAYQIVSMMETPW
ncbi:MAG TPA: LptE family protein [Pirellulales bacterium]|nr:LptE family protein [Pirellulales bacterium]